MILINYRLKEFDSLTLRELYDIMILRQEIFVVEQDCPYLDADGIDLSSFHLLGTNDENELLSYTRLVPKNVSFEGYCSIGRVIVAESVRKQGEGKRIMKESIGHCQELFPHDPIKISGQSYLLKFYTELGFTKVGEEYLEDGIPHWGMIYKL